MKEKETDEQQKKIFMLENRIERLTDDCITLEAENVILVSRLVSILS